MAMDKHKVQGISLLVAAIFLWVPIANLEHKTAMLIATAIIVVNAVMEFN